MRKEMNLSGFSINAPSPEELHHLFFDPPDPPELPAIRLSRAINKNIGRRHRKRKFKAETQGQADRRVRRWYRAQMQFYYSEQQGFDVCWDKLMPTMSPGSSLYDFIMQQKP